MLDPRRDDRPLPGAYRPQFIERRRDRSGWWLVLVGALVMLTFMIAIGSQVPVRGYY